MSLQIFASNLKYLRHKAERSKAQQAEFLGFGLPRYQAWEQAICYPQVEQLIVIGEKLEVDDLYLFLVKPINHLHAPATKQPLSLPL